MKTFLCRLLPLGLVVLALNSCVGPVPGTYGGGYGGGGYAPAPSYGSGYSDYDAPDYRDEDFYYYEGGPRPYYLGGYSSVYVGYSYYRGRGLCPVCHHSPCHGHSGRPSSFHVAHRDYDSHHYTSSSSHSSGPFYRPSSSSSSHSSSGPTLYRHLSSDNNRGAPQGEHTKEWFQEHGYSTSRLTPANGSSNSKSHSSSKKDDDDKHHRH